MKQSSRSSGGASNRSPGRRPAQLICLRASTSFHVVMNTLAVLTCPSGWRPETHVVAATPEATPSARSNSLQLAASRAIRMMSSRAWRASPPRHLTQTSYPGHRREVAITGDKIATLPKTENVEFELGPQKESIWRA
ncbi:hypothetical protein ANCDUO_09910 [Ancylostoma duodenale]|uniref:Uncharacterized protein n=1 Tax=Ancylostoma duodenale TaxID=51022 RepID=A0A0C2GLP5_9BILA|nr:hypothetical protein ANCDUO_09910 [Ancylostoma duodenale]